MGPSIRASDPIAATSRVADPAPPLPDGSPLSPPPCLSITTMPDWVPVIEGLEVSVAVREKVPNSLKAARN